MRWQSFFREKSRNRRNGKSRFDPALGKYRVQRGPRYTPVRVLIVLIVSLLAFLLGLLNDTALLPDAGGVLALALAPS